MNSFATIMVSRVLDDDDDDVLLQHPSHIM